MGDKREGHCSHCVHVFVAGGVMMPGEKVTYGTIRKLRGKRERTFITKSCEFEDFLSNLKSKLSKQFLRLAPGTVGSLVKPTRLYYRLNEYLSRKICK